MAGDRKAKQQLASFIAKYDPEVARVAEEVLDKMRIHFPTALELVYDNYNALAIGFVPSERTSDAIFSIVLYPKWVTLFFLQAKGLSDPSGILRGSGKVVRHIVLPSQELLEDPAVQDLMRQAQDLAKVPFDPSGAHRLIIKSISAKQRPRRPATKSAALAAPPKTQGKSTRKQASKSKP
jgi:hypothetical protein